MGFHYVLRILSELSCSPKCVVNNMEGGKWGFTVRVRVAVDFYGASLGLICISLYFSTSLHLSISVYFCTSLSQANLTPVVSFSLSLSLCEEAFAYISLHNHDHGLVQQATTVVACVTSLWQ